MRHNPFDPRDRRRRFEDTDLTRRILDRTSGSPCDRAGQLLGARWDGPLATTDQQLLDEHLAHCAACRELALVLDHLQPLLPQLAERDPGPAFTAGVLARTTGVGGIKPAPTPWLDRVAARLADAAQGLWNRPRFALEAAWTATAILALLVWGPLAPASDQEGEDPAARAVQVITAGTGIAPQLADWVDRRIEAAETAVDDLVHLSGAEAAERLTNLGRGAQAHGHEIWTQGQAIVSRLLGRASDETEDDDPAGE
jgi:hypothetical protein